MHLTNEDNNQISESMNHGWGKLVSCIFNVATSLNCILWLLFILWLELFHVFPKKCRWFLSNRVTRNW